MPQNERSALLHRLADAVEKHKRSLLRFESLDAGKILGKAQGDVQNLLTRCATSPTSRSMFACASPSPCVATKRGLRKHAWGACGFIFPWNFPFLLIGWGISPALAAGNTVVISLPKILRYRQFTWHNWRKKSAFRWRDQRGSWNRPVAVQHFRRIPNCNACRLRVLPKSAAWSPKRADAICSVKLELGAKVLRSYLMTSMSTIRHTKIGQCHHVPHGSSLL